MSTRDITTATAPSDARTDEHPAVPTGEHDESGPLLSGEDATSYQRQWEELQTGFVDDPRKVVAEADELVATVMRRLAEGFADERERLEAHWDRGEDVSTEDLRVALQRYRSFFRRLVTT